MNATHLKAVAGLVWLSAGIMLIIRACPMLQKASDQGTALWVLLTASFLGLLMGAAKGQFVLAKSARRNIIRLESLPVPLKPWHIFPLYLYPLILIMIAMGKSLKWSAEQNYLPGSWTTAGAVYLGIGAALSVSSLFYFKKKAALN